MSSNIPCIPSNHTETTIFNIGVHVTILFAILTVFFIVIVNKITHKLINKEFVNTINDGLGPKLNEIFESVPEITPYLSKLSSTKIFTDEDLTVQYNNKWQTITVYMTLGFLVILTIIYPLILRYQGNTCLPIKNIIILNIVIFSFIAIVEYLFFTQIAMNFVPVKPSVLLTSLLANLKQILQK